MIQSHSLLIKMEIEIKEFILCLRFLYLPSMINISVYSHKLNGAVILHLWPENVTAKTTAK